jgi:hypothetical protein
MARIIEGSGESLVLASVIFEAEGFCFECVIEARADFVGFAILVENGSIVSALGGCVLKFSDSLPIVPMSS